ncbi:MAG: hypothetical protein L0Y56_05805, partial [Nitrospira sp.]|nr:hypothetical protein [Nitrospira sp.]
MDEAEIVQIVCDLVRQNTVNPPGNEYLCKEIVTEKMKRLGMEVAYYEKEPGRTNVVGKIGKGKRSFGFVSHMDVVPPGEMSLWETDPDASRRAWVIEVRKAPRWSRKNPGETRRPKPAGV